MSTNSEKVKICLFCKNKHVTHQLINQKIDDATNMQLHYICESCFDKYFNHKTSEIIDPTNKFIGLPLRDFLCSPEYLNNTKNTYIFQNIKKEEITDFTSWMAKSIKAIDKQLDNKIYITIHD